MIGKVIKNLREFIQLSQEELAQKLGITTEELKLWELGIRIPDESTQEKIAQLFHISRCDMLNDKQQPESSYRYSLLSEYEVMALKNYDISKEYEISFGKVEELQVSTHPGSKITVLFASHEDSSTLRDYAVTVDDSERRLDMKVKSMGASKAPLPILILNIPCINQGKIELKGNATRLFLSAMEVEHLEFDGIAAHVNIRNVSGHIELNCNHNLDITVDRIDGQLDINQILASSVLHISKNCVFNVYNKGRWTTLKLEGVTPDEDSPNGIELNGMRSSLTIAADKGE